VVSGSATILPKIADGPIEALRLLRVAREGAVKARTAATNTLRGLLVTAPEGLRSQLPRAGSATALARKCGRLRPHGDDLVDPTQAAKLALLSVAGRVAALDAEVRNLDRTIAGIVEVAAPATASLFAIGPETASALLVAVSDNPDRLRSEKALARLCGAAPIPASSGKTTRHRLHRGGDRSANKALHTVVIVRMRYCPRTRAYVARRTADGLSKREVIRCLKRYLVREVFRTLRTDYAASRRLDNL
jgi:transposase